MILDFDSKNPFGQTQNIQSTQQLKNHEVTQNQWSIFYQLAKFISNLLISFNIKLWTVLTILVYILLLIKFACWTAENGLNQQYTNSILIIIAYKFLKIFSYIHSQEILIESHQSKHNIQSQKKTSRFLYAVVKPIQLFWISNIICQMIMVSKLQVMFFSIFFGIFAPLITEYAQVQFKQSALIKRIKGKYLIIVIMFLSAMSIRPILRYILIFDFYLPQLCAFAACFYIFALFFCLTLVISQRIIDKPYFSVNRRSFMELIYIFSLIYVPLTHYIIGYHLDTILNTRFIQRNMILMIASIYSGNKFIERQLNIKSRIISILQVGFICSFSIVIPLVYFVPVYGKMGDIVFYCLYQIFLIIPSIYWFIKSTYLGVITLKKNTAVII